MEELKVQKISDTLNEQPLVVEIDIKKPGLFSKKKVRVFTVYPPTLSKMMKVSAEVEKLQGVEEMFTNKDYASILQHLPVNGEILVKIIAIYLDCNDKFISDNVTITEAANLLLQLIEFSKLQDFLTTIILTKGMSLMNREEIIAPEVNDKVKTSTKP